MDVCVYEVAAGCTRAYRNNSQSIRKSEPTVRENAIYIFSSFSLPVVASGCAEIYPALIFRFAVIFVFAVGVSLVSHSIPAAVFLIINNGRVKIMTGMFTRKIEHAEQFLGKTNSTERN